MPTYSCRCCGKPLTDPLSAELEYGPVCRRNLKQKDAADMNHSLFGPRASYTYQIDGGVLSIIDQNDGRTVTNDIIAVLADLVGEGIDLAPLHIMYRDTSGVWDGVGHDGNRFTAFFALTTRDYTAAKTTLLALCPAKQ